MRNVVKQLSAAGVKNIVLGSPGAVDSKFFGTRASFGQQNSAAGYNATLAHLRDIAQKLAVENKQTFANVHNAMFDAMPKAKAALGAKFSIKEFHNVVLRGGSMPLSVLAQEVDAWVTARKAGG